MRKKSSKVVNHHRMSDHVYPEAFSALDQKKEKDKKVFEKALASEVFAQAFQAFYIVCLEDALCFEEAIERSYKEAIKECVQIWY